MGRSHHLPRHLFERRFVSSIVKHQRGLSREDASCAFFMGTNQQQQHRTIYRRIESVAIEEDFSVVSESAGDENPDISLFNTNDPNGFAAVYHSLSPYCIFLANSIVSADEAVDIVADCFLKLWLLPNKKFANSYHIHSYLKTCVRNRCFSSLEHRKTRMRNESAWQRLGNYEDDMKTLKEEIHAEKMSKIYNAIEQLPPKTKRVFRMAYIDGLKNRDIALALGVSEKTVVNQKVTALKALRITLLPCLFLLLLSSL